MAKKQKSKEPTLIKEISDENNQIRKFIIILVCLGVVCIGLYYLTAKYLVKDNFQDDDETAEVTISYDTIRVGNIFNRPYSTYYVFAYDSSSNKAVYYDALLSNYTKDDKIYYLDLGLAVNSKYAGEESNSSAKSVSELSITTPTLILIEDGQISKYYDDIEKIADILN